MALWDSADLLRRCKLHARRPATDQAMPDANWYDLLTEAQQAIYPEIAARKPDLLYSAPVLLTSADSGLTYTFGLDAAGDPIRPMGHTEVYPSLGAIPDFPLVAGYDFLLEGSLLRMPGNMAQTYQGGPYARFVYRPDSGISASVQPVLQPKGHRMLLVWKALEFWAQRPGSGVGADAYGEQYSQGLNRLFLEFATEYNGMAGPSPRAITVRGGGGSSGSDVTGFADWVT